MRRAALLLSVALVLAAVTAVPAGSLAAPDGVAAQQTTATGPPANETDANATADGDARANESSVAPGERLGGVLAVGQHEFETEVDSRSFGIQVAEAATENATASVVGGQVAEIRERVQTLERRQAALQRAHENGSLGDGAYRARTAAVAAELRGAERLANQTANASQGLPADLLESKGVNATAIQTLQQRASQLGGPAVAEIARSIAGPAVGQAPGWAGPGERGPSDRGPTNRTQGPPANATDTERSTDRGTTDPGANRTANGTDTEQGGPSSPPGAGNSDRR